EPAAGVLLVGAVGGPPPRRLRRPAPGARRRPQHLEDHLRPRAPSGAGPADHEPPQHAGDLGPGQALPRAGRPAAGAGEEARGRMYMLCARARDSLVLVNGPRKLRLDALAALPSKDYLTR